MRTRAPVQVAVQFPRTREGRQELSRLVSEVHADFVVSSINRLNCPARQKTALLQAVIDTVSGASGLSHPREQAHFPKIDGDLHL